MQECCMSGCLSVITSTQTNDVESKLAAVLRETAAPFIVHYLHVHLRYCFVIVPLLALSTESWKSILSSLRAFGSYSARYHTAASVVLLYRTLGITLDQDERLILGFAKSRSYRFSMDLLVH